MVGRKGGCLMEQKHPASEKKKHKKNKKPSKWEPVFNDPALNPKTQNQNHLKPTDQDKRGAGWTPSDTPAVYMHLCRRRSWLDAGETHEGN